MMICYQYSKSSTQTYQERIPMEVKQICVNCGIQTPKGSRFCSAYCMQDFQDKSNGKK